MLGGKKKDMKKIKLTEKDLLRIVKKTISEDKKNENYMFFSNLKQMRRQIDIMLNDFNPHWVDTMLSHGHDWADDKISESKTNIDSVFDFFMNKTEDNPHSVIEEKWSKKYKDSIDCNNPKGFSQKAHCKGRKK